MLGELMDSSDKILTEAFSMAMTGCDPAPEPKMENDDEFFMEFGGMENGQLSSAFASPASGTANTAPAASPAAPAMTAPAATPAPGTVFWKRDVGIFYGHGAL